MEQAWPLAGTAFGVGAALASAPGAVQAVLLSEATRGGVRRGLGALVGASATFAFLLALLTTGVAVHPPSGTVLAALQLAGGGLLLWLAWDALQSQSVEAAEPDRHPVLPPVLRGALAIVLNPGAWLFLAVVATPLLASAAAVAGLPASLAVAAALVVGAAAGDTLIVLLGGIVLPRIRARAARRVVLLLALLLAGIGLWLLVEGTRSLLAV